MSNRTPLLEVGQTYLWWTKNSGDDPDLLEATEPFKGILKALWFDDVKRPARDPTDKKQLEKDLAK